jgi:hypothetical protein
VQVVLNQEEAALCMAEFSRDTDSMVPESSIVESSEEESYSEAESSIEAPVATNGSMDYECAPSSSSPGPVADDTVKTRTKGAAAQLDAKMKELNSMVERAASGADAVQGTHEMMGQLWDICSHQQAQLSERDQVCSIYLVHSVVTS